MVAALTVTALGGCGGNDFSSDTVVSPGAGNGGMPPATGGSSSGGTFDSGGSGGASSGGRPDQGGAGSGASGGTGGTTGGSGGVGGTAGGDPGGSGGVAGAGGCGAMSCPGGGDVRLSYYPVFDVGPYPVNPDIRARIFISNHGSADIPLSELAIRYWFTLEATGTLLAFVDYCENCSPHMTSIGTTDRQQADRYAEISWPYGTLPADPSADNDIHLRIDTDTLTDFDHSNDWSCNPAFASPGSEWERITIYRNGVLIWGSEPPE